MITRYDANDEKEVREGPLNMPSDAVSRTG